MELGCTKNLLEYLGVKPTKPTLLHKPLFSWTANLITLNRRKTVVVMNCATQCTFILFGITAKNLNDMPYLILNGIRGLLESEYVAPEIIEKYLAECGENVSFVSNSSRSAISYCNNACRRIEYFSNLFEPGDLYQTKYLPWINNDLCGYSTGAPVRLNYEKLISCLKEEYGESVQSASVAVLDVTLDLLTPCKRTIKVPCDINFYQLHNILQAAFSWYDSHLHRFEIDGETREIISVHPDDDYAAIMKEKNINSLEVTVGEIFSRCRKLKYVYDFGDEWEHIVRLKKFVKDCREPYPCCTEAIGDTPVEDCGGKYGYARLKNILNNPEHSEYNEIYEWCDGSVSDPADIKWINYTMKERFRRIVPVTYD